MKRKELLQILAKAGFSIKEGGSHSIILNQDGKPVSVLPRHVELAKRTVLNILKQTGIQH